MKLTVGSLRRLITEEVSKKTLIKVHELMRDVTAAAEGYLRAVKMKSDSPGKFHDELVSGAEELATMATWLISHREDGSEAIGKFAKVALDLSKLSSFFNRPAFVGRSSYVQQVEDLVDRLRRFRRESRPASSAPRSVKARAS